MKYLVRIRFQNLIYTIDVTAKNKPEAYNKAKEKLAKRLFKMSNLKNYTCDEII